MLTQKVKKLLCMLAAGFLLCFQGGYVFADGNLLEELSVSQQTGRTVTGTVVDSQGDPLIGVSIGVQGTAIGTVTDQNGRYSIQVPGGNQILQFSYLGYKNLTKPADKNQIDVVMEEDSKLLDEVLITAEFGLKRVASSVGTSVQNVKASDITDSGRDNFISALQGRVSGINVVSSGGAPGASTTVTLRSMTSLSGNNQPLYVIDGVPMNNSSFNPTSGFAGTETYSSRYLDFSSRGNDFNPEDIESMTILKGAAAAALYGSDASNGAIIITTRKGQAGAGKVSYSNSFRWDTAYGIPERQTKYANGAYGATHYYYAANFGGLYPEGTKFYDNLSALMQTGFTQRHNIAVEGGSDKVTVRAAASITDQTGIIKTTDYTRNNVSLNSQGQITKWLKFDSSIQYAGTTNTKVNRGPNTHPLFRASRWPIHDDMSNWLHPDGIHMRYPERYNDSDILNPLFLLYKNKYYDVVDRMLGNIGATLTPVKNTFLRFQYGFDTGSSVYEASEHPYWRSNNLNTAPGVGGTYNLSSNTFTDQNINLIAGWSNKYFNDLFDIQAQLGYHQTENYYNNLATKGENYLVTDLASINNCLPSTVTSKKRVTTRRLQAISAQLQLGYSNIAYLTLSGRNDWSSTLPIENNRYFYPTASLSLVLSEMSFLKGNTALSYLKLRGSITRVGKDANPLSINPELIPTARTGGGYKYDFTGPNLALKPEMQTSKDVGFEARFMDNRINADFSYFNTYCKDQIVSGFRMSYANGFVLNTRNIGEFKTWGWEGHIDGDIIRNRDWLWNFGVNLSATKSEVVDLPVASYYDAYTWNSGNLRNGAMVGEPITVIIGNDYQRNDKGDVLIDPATGVPMATTDLVALGDREPKLRVGFSTRLRYKNWNLSALTSGKLGATVINGTYRQMLQQGTSWQSVTLRESGPVVFNGVIKDGKENTDNPTINNIAVTYGNYGTTTYSGLDPDWIERNINYIRLQEVRLGYTIPSTVLRNFSRGLISSASVFMTANDLFTWTNYSGVDAVGNTVAASAGGIGGEAYDVWSLPNPRGFTCGISLTF